MSKDWAPEEAVGVVAKVLITSDFGKSIDMDQEEAEALAAEIVKALDQ